MKISQKAYQLTLSLLNLQELKILKNQSITYKLIKNNNYLHSQNFIKALKNNKILGIRIKHKIRNTKLLFQNGLRVSKMKEQSQAQGQVQNKLLNVQINNNKILASLHLVKIWYCHFNNFSHLSIVNTMIKIIIFVSNHTLQVKGQNARNAMFQTNKPNNLEYNLIK